MRDLMIERTHSDHAPWIIVRGQRQAAGAACGDPAHIAERCPMPAATLTAIGKPDAKIIGEGPKFL